MSPPIISIVDDDASVREAIKRLCDLSATTLARLPRPTNFSNPDKSTTHRASSLICRCRD